MFKSLYGQSSGEDQAFYLSRSTGKLKVRHRRSSTVIYRIPSRKINLAVRDDIERAMRQHFPELEFNNPRYNDPSEDEFGEQLKNLLNEVSRFVAMGAAFPNERNYDAQGRSYVIDGREYPWFTYVGGFGFIPHNNLGRPAPGFYNSW